ncbi:hypothetical protein LOZ64_000157 [Ophidiomyces ophidiicola]|nr:hypothetical protein LOZ64_000157 [Ophidiomyces ophidiicola]KAI2014444.1 hypothetical protein LOZ49_001356 [Ophidiomyces ophidiicola]KAI2021405.1 hypothetical protein LOZ46_002418 [Ophidiomyces ophidiicola]KAI2040719.1 hypothetical protein LOZ47_001091 [Ophidiomyces ophidiicola]KAI2059101.1 hypothetical protein LOZ44_000692 [Ophidiomyces ophidiicola]
MDAPQRPSATGFRMRPKPPPIQTTALQKRPHMRPKPPLPQDVAGATSDERVPLRAPKPHASRSSLRTFMNKTISMRRNTMKPDSAAPLILESKPVVIPASVGESPVSQTISRQNSMKPQGDPAPIQPPAVASSSDSSLRLSKSTRERRGRAVSSWEPPPLFKAYPQAIKHAILSAPDAPTDSILRAQQLVKQGKREHGLDTDGNDWQPNDLIYKMGWTRKIYMLATSGYLLQYSGDGNFDRLPEMILELGEYSVAFASDAIPGKHWVLQISQSYDGNGTTPVDNKKNLFSRLRLTDSPKIAKSFLLVLDNADDLGSWLQVVRREIEGLGGKEYVPETPVEEETPQSLHRYQSMTSMRKSDHDRRIRTRSSLSVSSNRSQAAQTLHDDIAVLRANSRRGTQPFDAPSLSSATTGSDYDGHLNGSRLSYVSAGARTATSSHCSSPPSSSAEVKPSLPKNPFFESPDAFNSSGAYNIHMDAGHRPISIVREPRDSVSLNTTNPQQSNANQQRAKPPLLPAPNFSVPVFSKRFSSASNLRASQSCASIPAVDMPSTIPVRLPSHYSSETLIDSSPESFPPIEHKPVKRVGTAHGCIAPPSTKDNGNRSTDMPTSSSVRYPFLNSKSSQSRTCRHRASENNIAKHSPIAELAPETPLASLDPPRQTHDTPHPPCLMPARGTMLRPRRPLDESTPPPQRPLSLQAKTLHIFPPLSTTTPGHPLKSRNSLFIQPSAVKIHRSPPEDTRKNNLSSRRSMPQMAFGPPPAPPPDCPLPDIPSVAAQRVSASWKAAPPPAAGRPPSMVAHQTGARTTRNFSLVAHSATYRASASMHAGGLGDMHVAEKPGVLHAY